MFDHDPSLRVKKFVHVEVSRGKKSPMRRCTHWKDCFCFGVRGVSSFSCLGTVGLPRLQDLHCSAALQLHRVLAPNEVVCWNLISTVFCCLINPPSWSGSHPKYKNKLKTEKDLLCVEFALERNWNLRFHKVWSFPPSIYHIKGAEFGFLSSSVSWFGLSHILFSHS